MPATEELIAQLQFETGNFEGVNGYGTYAEYSDEAPINILGRSVSDMDGQVSVAGESNSQYIRFCMGRFADGIDLTSKRLQIHYELQDGSNAENAPVNVLANEDTIMLGWIVPPQATQMAGNIKLTVWAIGETDKGTYIWKTVPRTYKVSEGFVAGGGINEPDNNWYEQFVLEMQSVIDGASGAIKNATDAAESAAIEASSATQGAAAATIAANAAADNADVMTNNLQAVYERIKDTDVGSLADELANIEIGGRNIIKDSNNFLNWTKYGGATVTFETGISMPEWGAADATRIITDGGSDKRKLYTTIGKQPSIAGFKYVSSVWIKNEGENTIVVTNNMGDTKQVLSGESKRITLKGAGNGSSWNQIMFSATNVSDGLQFIAWRAQVEHGAIATDWTPAPEDMTTVATQGAAGLMSAVDKAKLDAIEASANKTTITNNLGTTTTGSALDAAQGKVLDDKISILNNDLSNIEIGGRNLLKDSRLIGMGANNSVLRPIAREKIEDGDITYYRVKNAAISTDSITISVYNAIPFAQISEDLAGKTVILSHKVRSSVTQYLAYYAGLYGTSNYNYQDHGKATPMVEAGMWQTISLTVTIPGDLSGYTGVRFIAHPSTYSVEGQYIDYRDWKIEFGNKVTDWTPAPEDKADATISTTATNGLMSAADKAKLDGIAAGADKTDIANNLTTEITGSALDAAQGKVLADSITATNSDLANLFVTKPLTLTVELADLQATINALPKILLASVTIKVKPGTTTMDIYISRFSGSGTLAIMCVNASGNTVTTTGGITHSIPFIAIDNNSVSQMAIQGFNFTNYEDENPIHLCGNSGFLNLNYCSATAENPYGDTNAGIYAGSNPGIVVVNNHTVSNKHIAFYADNSRLSITNPKGTNNGTLYYSTAGGFINVWNIGTITGTTEYKKSLGSIIIKPDGTFA